MNHIEFRCLEIPKLCSLKVYNPRDSVYAAVFSPAPFEEGNRIGNCMDLLASVVHLSYMKTTHPENILWVEVCPIQKKKSAYFNVTFDYHGIRIPQHLEMELSKRTGIKVLSYDRRCLFYRHPRFERLTEKEVDGLLKRPVLG